MEQEINTYNLWNISKIHTAQSKPKNVKNGHIYWVKIGKNIGCEVFGKGDLFARPVLVVKRLQNSLFFGIPLSSKIKNNPHSHIFVDSRDKRQNALLNQMRMFDTRRIVSRCSKINEVELQNIVDKISAYILAK